MVKSFVGCLAALAVWEVLKKKYSNMYHWECDSCKFSVHDSDKERGVDTAYRHIKSEHSI